MTHLLYSSVMMIGFYAGYWCCLRTLTFHTLNRFYLLFALVASVAIPVMPGIPVAAVVNDSMPMHTEAVEPVSFLGFAITDWLEAAGYVYGVGVVVFLLQLLVGLFRIYRHIRQGTVTLWNQLRVIPAGQPTASFFHWVFLNESEIREQEKEIVLTHEYEHFRRRHSLDLLFVEIIRCVLWFHPVVYWLRRSLIQIHEYEVDASLAQQYGAKPYAQVLLTLAVSQPGTLTHSFARHPIKNRIETLFLTPTNPMKKALFLLALPLTAVSMTLFAQQSPEPPPPPAPPAPMSVVAPPPPPEAPAIAPPPPVPASSIAPPPPVPPPPPPVPQKKMRKKSVSRTQVKTTAQYDFKEVRATGYLSFLRFVKDEPGC